MSDTMDKKSPDLQSTVKATQTSVAAAANNNNQSKQPSSAERMSAYGSLPKAQEVAVGSRKPSSSSVVKKSSTLSGKRTMKGKLKKPNNSNSTASMAHLDSFDSEDDFEDGDLPCNNQSQDSKTTSNSVISTSSAATAGRSASLTTQRMSADEWEILEGLKNGQLFEEVPQKYAGYMMKSRKWPMKGWHKRFFVLENGILVYGKTMGDIEKGKYHGTVDIGLSVIACKRKGRRIDVDADDLIYHLKVKSTKEFEEWTCQLRQHRLHRQHEISYGTKEAPRLITISSPNDDFSSHSSPLSPDTAADRLDGFDMRCDGGVVGGMSARSHNTLDRSQGKVSAWMSESSNLETWNKELSSVQVKLFELSAILEKLQINPTSGMNAYAQEFQDLAISPTSKKPKTRKPILRKKERKNKDHLSVADGLMSVHLSTSNPNLITMEEPVTIGPSSSTNHNASDLDKLQEQFCRQAEQVHNSLMTICRTVTKERERLKQVLMSGQDSSLISLQTNSNYVQSLKQTLTEALKQNTDYRNRLNRIQSECTLTDLKPLVPPLCLSSVFISSGPPSEKDRMHFTATGSLDSLTEFYDAEEQLASSSDVSEEEEDEDEDLSDTETKVLPASEELHDHFTRFQMRRRSKLPSPKVESDVGVFSLLRKNIGKDLSKISMPVSMNEPLNALQRLCEELEYSELLDRCAEFEDPFERMVWVAAFAVSGYASSFTRAGQKPFNPLLGETYESIREDKGWKFVAEQVSHHPPVSACFCESKNFLFWQDMQVKTKFWGKSMEVEPIGVINLKLSKQKEHYSWNKATSCVHNILGGQRWVEHYGEVIITNHLLDIVCKLTFAKSSYWSSNRHQVYGSVCDKDGKAVHHLFGQWNEGIYYGNVQSAKCIWRPGAMPPDSEIYYGFTRFAMELNEIDSEQVHLYPSTDTRFRPDQRLLEEGKLNEAENEKQRVEQHQREIRKTREDGGGAPYLAKWFTKCDVGNKETYMFNAQYWETRKNPGFCRTDFPKLW